MEIMKNYDIKIVETKHQKKSWKTSNKNFFSDMKIVETKNQESFMWNKPEANGSQSWYLMRSFADISFKKFYDVINIK